VDQQFATLYGLLTWSVYGVPPTNHRSSSFFSSGLDRVDLEDSTRFVVVHELAGLVTDRQPPYLDSIVGHCRRLNPASTIYNVRDTIVT
jgi:hypothetical protein